MSRSQQILSNLQTTNEDYGTVRKTLEKEFDRAVASMKGSTVDAKSIWIDLGVSKGFITESQGEKL